MHWTIRYTAYKEVLGVVQHNKLNTPVVHSAHAHTHTHAHARTHTHTHTHTNFTETAYASDYLLTHTHFVIKIDMFNGSCKCHNELGVLRADNYHYHFYYICMSSSECHNANKNSKKRSEQATTTTRMSKPSHTHQD